MRAAAAPVLKGVTFHNSKQDGVNPVIVGGKLGTDLFNRTVVFGLQTSAQTIG